MVNTLKYPVLREAPASHEFLHCINWLPPAVHTYHGFSLLKPHEDLPYEESERTT
jgi:hypothetical protein